MLKASNFKLSVALVVPALLGACAASSYKFTQAGRFVDTGEAFSVIQGDSHIIRGSFYRYYSLADGTRCEEHQLLDDAGAVLQKEPGNAIERLTCADGRTGFVYSVKYNPNIPYSYEGEIGGRKFVIFRGLVSG